MQEYGVLVIGVGIVLAIGALVFLGPAVPPVPPPETALSPEWFISPPLRDGALVASKPPGSNGHCHPDSA
jgi:hypothetical protein